MTNPHSSGLLFDPASIHESSLELLPLPGDLGVTSSTGVSLLDKLRQRWCSDEQLALQLQNGVGDALTRLFKRHHRLVFAIARRILRNDAEAEDAVQQVFLDVFRSIEKFNPGKGEFKTWLLMFAYHRAFNMRRALSAGGYFTSEPLDGIALDPACPDQSIPRFSLAESRVLIEQGLRSLPARERRTIELAYYSGLTAQEISNRTGETVRVVRHNLYRGLDKMRRALRSSSSSTEKKGERR